MFRLQVVLADGTSKEFTCTKIIVHENEGLSFVGKSDGIGEHEETIIQALVGTHQIINFAAMKKEG